jgi:hypothetical protein
MRVSVDLALETLTCAFFFQCCRAGLTVVFERSGDTELLIWGLAALLLGVLGGGLALVREKPVV